MREIRALTRGPVGVNVILELQPPEAIEAILAEGIDVLATGFGDPEPWIERAHAAGARIFHRCETPAEARAAARAGADVVIAQGSDSGGHTGIVPTFALVPQVVDAAEGTPVLAAGGIADGRGLIAALALGAEGVLLGTRLVASEESGAHPVYKSGIVAAQAADSIVTDIFEIGWPGRPERVLRNATTDAWGREPEPRSRPSARPVEIIARRLLARRRARDPALVRRHSECRRRRRGRRDGALRRPGRRACTGGPACRRDRPPALRGSRGGVRSTRGAAGSFAPVIDVPAGERTLPALLERQAAALRRPPLPEGGGDGRAAFAEMRDAVARTAGASQPQASRQATASRSCPRTAAR